MATVPDPRPHPLHLVLLAGMLPPFLGALLSDCAYSKTFETQWHVFAEWLLAGGLVFTGLALGCVLLGLFRADGRTGRALLALLALVATFAAGFVASLLHARDAWAMMPAGPWATGVTALLALVSIWVGFSGWRRGGLA